MIIEVEDTTSIDLPALRAWDVSLSRISITLPTLSSCTTSLVYTRTLTFRSRHATHATDTRRIGRFPAFVRALVGD